MYEIELREIYELFESTKHILKLIEHRHAPLSVANSETQLRFAGLHLARAINASSSSRNYYYFNEQMAEIKLHCFQSKNYAYEYGIEECVSSVDLFVTSFEETVTLGLVQSLSDIKTRAFLAKEFVDFDDINRDGYKSHYDSIYNDLQTLQAVYDELIKKLKEEKRKKLFAIVAVIVTFIATMGTFADDIVNFRPETLIIEKKSPETRHQNPSVIELLAKRTG